MRTSQEVNCLYCGESFLKAVKEVRRSPNHFCSRSHAASYNNVHVKRRGKRSKLERWLSMRLSEVYKGLPVLYNDRKTLPDGLELDIYVPSLQLAFELNGPAHYQPIYGADALKKIQEKDKLKKIYCEERGIELLVVDISDLPKFKHHNLEKHTKFVLTEVKKRIESKTS